MTYKTKRSYMLYAIMANILSNIVNGSITISPHDTEVLVGQSTYFNCSTSINDTDVNWYFYPAGGTGRDRKSVYAAGTLYDPYDSRSRIDHSTSNAHNLEIFSMTLQDAGRYECHDDVGIGETKSGQMIVLDTNPVCQSSLATHEVIGPNSCGIEPEELRLSCSATFNGNIPPILEWKSAKKAESLNNYVTWESVGKNVHYNLSIKADLLVNDASYQCQTTRSTADQLKCTTGIFNVLYAVDSEISVEVAMGDNITCIANTTQSCNYRWEWFDGVNTETVSNNQNLTANKSGWHRCKAECKLKQYQCQIQVMLVLVPDSSAELSGLSSGQIASISTGAIVVVCLLIAGVGLITWMILQKGKKYVTNVDESVALARLAESNELDNLDAKTIVSSLSFIDRGSSGEFYGPWKWHEKQYVWQKILFPRDTNASIQDEIRNKADIWKELDHKNLMKFECVRFQAPTLCILMEYAEGGTVRKVLDNCESNLPIQRVHNWAIQIAEGMNYLHEHEILHRHLQCGQIFVTDPSDPSSPGTNQLKIGSYRIALEDNKTNPTVSKMLFAWMSPEVQKNEKQPYLKSSDIWSYGITVWEILTRQIPHKGIKMSKALHSICYESQNLPIPESCSEVLVEILTGCWDRDWLERPTFRDILSKLASTQT